MKQTAVEWLIQELRGTDDKGDFIFQGVINSELIEQAKENEKQQHKQTWFESTSQFSNEAEMLYKKDFEQYYNETFNK